MYVGLQNDHKALMKQIESGLQSYYNTMPACRANRSTSNDVEMQIDRPAIVVHKIPFAKVDVVIQGSPADYSVSIYI